MKPECPKCGKRNVQKLSITGNYFCCSCGHVWNPASDFSTRLAALEESVRDLQARLAAVDAEAERGQRRLKAAKREIRRSTK